MEMVLVFIVLMLTPLVECRDQLRSEAIDRYGQYNESSFVGDRSAGPGASEQLEGGYFFTRVSRGRGCKSLGGRCYSQSKPCDEGYAELPPGKPYCSKTRKCCYPGSKCTEKEGPYKFLPVGALKTHRAGAWLPRDDAVIGVFLKELRESVAASTSNTLVEPVKALDVLVRSDPALYGNAQAMFYEASKTYGQTTTPLGTPSLQNWTEFISHLNHIVQNHAPGFYTVPGHPTEASGVVAFPINALLDWPMGTLPGFAVFSNAEFNNKMKDVLNYWIAFLTSPASTYTLTGGSTGRLAWLNPIVLKKLVDKVNDAVNNPKTYTSFEEVFECNPNLSTYGFENWDEFFTREFKPNVRNVMDKTDPWKIANACESAPLKFVKNVKLEDKFWLKEQAYSLKDMIDYGNHTYAASFANGTVYQAFLSGLSFHQWRSPISGTVVASYNIPGTYYLQSYYKGFEDYDKGCPDKSDPAAPNDSQPYLSSVSTRSVIIIESAVLGKVAFIAVGMAEVGSCDNQVTVGQTISKGDPIGTFHYGGSSHCLVFEPKVELEFIEYINKHASINATHNVAISSTIATATV